MSNWKSGSRFLRRTLSGAAFSLCAMGAAHAEGFTLQEVAAVMTADGLTANVSEEASEATIYAEADGFEFALSAFSCDAAAKCEEYVFNAYFETTPKLTLEQVNAFNAATVAGRSYLDDNGDANIEHMFAVTGAEQAIVSKNIEIWRRLLIDFQIYLDEVNAPTDAEATAQ